MKIFVEVWVTFRESWNDEIDASFFTDPSVIRRDKRAYLLRVPVPSDAFEERETADGEVLAEMTGETTEPCA